MASLTYNLLCMPRDLPCIPIGSCKIILAAIVPVRAALVGAAVSDQSMGRYQPVFVHVEVAVRNWLAIYHYSYIIS